MTEITDPVLRAISQLRADIFAMREEVRPLAGRLETVESQFGEIITLLEGLKAGQAAPPPKISSFIGKRS